MLHQTLPILGQLWQLFEVSQILEFLRYKALALLLSKVIEPLEPKATQDHHPTPLIFHMKADADCDCNLLAKAESSAIALHLPLPF